MVGYLCWVCRRTLKSDLPESEPLGWGKCIRCSKTREQRQPPVVKRQPLSKRERQKAIKRRAEGLG